jgi:SAM-dependent methyltransferase
MRKIFDELMEGVAAMKLQREGKITLLSHQVEAGSRLTVLRACPLCGCDNASRPPDRYSQPPWLLKRCSQCGLVYLENPVAYSALENEMAWEKTYAAEAETRRQRNPILYRAGRAPKALWQRLLRRDKLVSWIQRYIAPGPVLDVGCAGGHTLERLPPQFVPYGIEISAELSRLANQRFAPRGGRVVQGDALSALRQFDAGFFTGVIMTSFLEHESQPRAVLAAAARVMHPEARLIVKVPNFASWNRALRGARWCGFRFPDHVNYFTPQQIAGLVRGAGFQVLRFGIFDRFPTSDNMWLLARRNP